MLYSRSEIAGKVAIATVPLILFEFPYLISRDLKFILCHLGVFVNNFESEGGIDGDQGILNEE